MASRTMTHQAYEAATSRLRRLYPNEFQTLYNEEREARGLRPLKTLRERRGEEIRDLEARLARLREEA